MAETKQEVGFLDEHSGEGLENIEISDLSLPFLRVAQPLSPQIDKDSEEFLEGLQVGMFFNTVTNRIYGKEINLIPMKYERSWVEWKQDRGGFVARHIPGSIDIDKSDFSKWKYNANVIQDTLMFYCMVADRLNEGPIVFCLSSTGIKHGKNWMTQINMTRLPSGKQAPIFSSVWKLFTTKQQNAKGSFYQIGGKSSNVSRARFIKPDEYSTFVAPNIEGLKNMSVDLKQLTDSSNETESQEPEETKDGVKTGY